MQSFKSVHTRQSEEENTQRECVPSKLGWRTGASINLTGSPLVCTGPSEAGMGLYAHAWQSNWGAQERLPLQAGLHCGAPARRSA